MEKIQTHITYDDEGYHDLPDGLTPIGCAWQRTVHLVGPGEDRVYAHAACEHEHERAEVEPLHRNLRLLICAKCRRILEARAAAETPE